MQISIMNIIIVLSNQQGKFSRVVQVFITTKTFLTQPAQPR